MPISDPSGGGLVLPGEGHWPLGPLLARYLEATCRNFLTIAADLPGPSEAIDRTRLAALQALRRDRRATLACFASPTVGTAIHCLALRADLAAFRDRIDAAAATLAPHLLLELALRRLLPEADAIDWPAPLPPLASLSLGAAFASPGLRFASGRLIDRATGASLPLTQGAVADAVAAADPGSPFRVTLPYRRLGGVTRLALIDHNPIASFEVHPEKSGNALDLGGRTVEEWAAALEPALALIASFLPELHAEMGMLLHEVIPVGFHAERHLSASYREAIGSAWLSLHPHPMTMAEALIHEFQHNKLNLASHGMTLLENAFAPLYPSPVRPDPRPLWGLLLAVHAFLPVAVLYRRMRAALDPHAGVPDFARRLAEIDLRNHEGMEMLRAHGRFTSSGRHLMADLDALDRAHMAERGGERASDGWE
ncbi:MAG: hypothetical protein EXR72_18235 [Myxococcales bacterium]|nr:hypothetical protein [Myxococcales bacterium]